MLGVNSSAEGELCKTVHVQTNSRVVSSETSTKLLKCRLILTRSSFTGLDPLSCRHVSLLSRVDYLRPCPSPTAKFSVPLSHSLTGIPSPPPVTSRSWVKNPLSGFAPKQTKESSAWRTTYTVLQQISHADGLSRLVPKYSEPFEDTIIAALRTDCEIKNMIANTIKELPVTLLEIKSEAMNDDFITHIKQKITAKKRKSTRSIFTMWQRLPI